MDGFTVDIVRGDLLIEIQTRNLSGMRRKLDRLVARYQVLLVYPIALEKWIVRQSPNGRITLGRRKSPKRGSVESIFEELVSIARLLAHPNFTLQVALIQEEQVRRVNGSRNWRRKGWGAHERRLLKVVGERLFETPQDVLAILPSSLREPFTTGDISQATGLPLRLSQKMAYCLREMGTIQSAGKRSRSILYTRVGDQLSVVREQ